MKIGITGCKGRMGALLVQEILSGRHPDATLAGGSALPAEITKKEDFFVTENPDELFTKSDAVIDFTVPEATRKHVWLAAKHKKTLVIGTTGLTDTDEKEIRDAAKETRIVMASNFSMGVNLLLALVEKAAGTLGSDWD